ncbi:hypothetical protein [Colwellia sp. E150_009]
MSGSTINLYLSKDDLSDLCSALGKVGPHNFTEVTSKLNEQNCQFTQPLGLSGFLVTYDKPNQLSRFLLSEESLSLNSREIKMKDGSGVKTIIDQNYNPDTIEILLGGEAAPKVIVATTLRTTGETKVAKELFKLYKKTITKLSKKVGTGNYVLPDALEKMRSGWRLASALDTHPSLDLKE